MEALSKHDKAVLDVMFDPLQLMKGSEVSLEQEAVNNSSSENIESLPADIADMVVEAIRASEEQRYDESLRLFEAAIVRAPKSAAVLNDRAQALRLAGRDDDALEDLNLSLELSKGRGKPGIRALCQRGIIHRCAGRLDKARRDFEAAARGGSSFARTQLVNLNPYAAMCNAMLRDMTTAATTLDESTSPLE